MDIIVDLTPQMLGEVNVAPGYPPPRVVFMLDEDNFILTDDDGNLFTFDDPAE